MKEYHEEKQAKQNERQKQLDAVVDSFPRINKLIESFPDFTLLQDLAKKIPKMVQLLDTKEKKDALESGSHSESMQQQQDIPTPMQKHETVDASMSSKETSTNVEKVLFEM